MSVEVDSISIGSSFSFADTAPLGVPSEISVGGIFSNASFLDYSPIASVDLGLKENTVVLDVFNQEFAGINLDPDKPSYEIPQVFTDTVSDQELLEPSLFSEQINVLDMPIDTSNNAIIEHINYSIDPEISQTEAKLSEIFGEPLTAPKLEILERKIEDLNNFETVYQLDETQEVKAIDEVTVTELIEQVTTQVVSGPALQEAVEELKILTEAHVTTEPMVIPENTPINAQIYPEIIQATTTYESLMTAGIAETQAVELVQTALVSAGTKPEMVQQILTQVKTGAKTKMKKDEPSYAEASAGEEEKIEEEEAKKKQKKPEYKFVVDEKALSERYAALKAAVSKALKKLKDGKTVVDSQKAVANLPTEPEKHTLISEILPKYQIDLFGLEHGDGSYREAVKRMIGLSNLDPNSFLQKGSEIFRNLPPVKIALAGKVVKEVDVKRVRSYMPDSIRSLRKSTTYSQPNNN